MYIYISKEVEDVREIGNRTCTKDDLSIRCMNGNQEDINDRKDFQVLWFSNRLTKPSQHSVLNV